MPQEPSRPLRHTRMAKVALEPSDTTLSTLILVLSSSTLVPVSLSQVWGQLELCDLTVQFDYYVLQTCPIGGHGPCW